MTRFAGKSIIVTGAGSGIGRAAARLFAQEGGSVLVADLTEGADETVALIRDAGGRAEAMRAGGPKRSGSTPGKRPTSSI